MTSCLPQLRNSSVNADKRKKLNQRRLLLTDYRRTAAFFFHCSKHAGTGAYRQADQVIFGSRSRKKQNVPLQRSGCYA